MIDRTGLPVLLADAESRIVDEAMADIIKEHHAIALTTMDASVVMPINPPVP